MVDILEVRNVNGVAFYTINAHTMDQAFLFISSTTSYSDYINSFRAFNIEDRRFSMYTQSFAMQQLV